MISQHIKDVLNGLSLDRGDGVSREGTGPLISINKITSRVGGMYEKVRYLIDYKEEHTVRRSAIQRILVRTLRKRSQTGFGSQLLLDLVTGGYLPNNGIVEQAGKDIDVIIDKYLFLRDECGVKDKYIFSLCATEIERFLFPQLINDLVLESFYKTASDSIAYVGSIPKEALDMQIYLSCRRSLLEDDGAMLLYSTLLKYFPEFKQLDLTNPDAKEMGLRLSEYILKIESAMIDPLGRRITSQLKDQAISFSVIRDIIKDFGVSSESIFDNQAQLATKVKEILNKKYQAQNDIATKSGTRAVIYILLTKVLLALLLEVPYERYFLGGLEYVPLATNVLFHPILLLIMVKTVKAPGSDNTNAVIANIENIVHGKNIKQIHVKPLGMGAGTTMLFGLLYFILFVLIFSGILWALRALHFNVASIVLFMFFLTLVSYLGFRIRYNANKWKVLSRDEGVIALLWNFITIPIIRTGQWLSKRFSTINIFVALMDFILETPFRLVLKTFDAFISFLRDKKDNPF